MPSLLPLSLPGLAYLGLEALMAAVSGPVKEAHVIVLHCPVRIHHRSVDWQTVVHLINEALPRGELAHHADAGIIWIVAHSVLIK